MNKSWKLIPKILSGEKTIESRWYQTRRAPWNRIRAGDQVYFKNSGEAVTAEATIADVMQFELGTLKDAQKIIDKYGKRICLVNKDPKSWESQPNYCILIVLKNPKLLKTPFQIDKTGFGNAAAWLTVESIKTITLR